MKQLEPFPYFLYNVFRVPGKEHMAGIVRTAIAAAKGCRYLCRRRRLAVRAWRALAPMADRRRRLLSLVLALGAAAIIFYVLRTDEGPLSAADSPAEWVQTRQSLQLETVEADQEAEGFDRVLPGFHFRLDEQGITFFHIREEQASGFSD